jgi:hypothetical protein
LLTGLLTRCRIVLKHRSEFRSERFRSTSTVRQKSLTIGPCGP